MFLFRKWLGLASAVGILGTVGLSGFMTSASAASLPSATVGMVRVTTVALPNVNIAGVPAKWSPTTLTVTPKPYTTCTKAKTVWTITNKTKKTQVLSYKVGTGAKKALGSLPAGVKAGLCSKGPAGTKETFFIKGSTSTLALTLS